MATDNFAAHSTQLGDTANGGEAVVITSADHTATQVGRGLWVGGAGAVKVTTKDGSVIVFSGVAAGTMLPVRVKTVWRVGTDATLMVIVW